MHNYTWEDSISTLLLISCHRFKPQKSFIFRYANQQAHQNNMRGNISLNTANEPVNESRQVHTLSSDTIDVTSVLLNHQLKDCVSQIQESGYEFLWRKVESQVMSRDETVYEFSAMLLSGDMGVGLAAALGGTFHCAKHTQETPAVG